MLPAGESFPLRVLRLDLLHFEMLVPQLGSVPWARENDISLASLEDAMDISSFEITAVNRRP